MFISFEGIDGCGKTTQLGRLKTHLEARGLEVVCTREPGGTSLAEALREILLHSKGSIQASGELLLFGAARAQHVAEVVRPALHRGAWVLCDRFIDSSEAYQGGGLGLDRAFIREMNDFATGHLKPQLTFLFDLSPEIGLARRAGEKGDRIEKRGLEFQAKVRAAYLEIAARAADRVRVLDASRSMEEVEAQILEILSEESDLKSFSSRASIAAIQKRAHFLAAALEAVDFDTLAAQPLDVSVQKREV